MPSLEQLIWILIFIFALLLVWVVMRFLLRLATRIFMLGCLAIVIIGLVLLALLYFGVI